MQRNNAMHFIVITRKQYHYIRYQGILLQQKNRRTEEQKNRRTEEQDSRTADKRFGIVMKISFFNMFPPPS